MGLFKIPFSLICVLGLVLVESSVAQNSPQDYLKVHNAARVAVAVGPLRWDEALAGYAQEYANRHINVCRPVYFNGVYGENIIVSATDLSGATAVKFWVGEKRNFNYNTNSCVGGNCRHYTQVVWRHTTKVGCGRVRCNDGGTFIVCFYSPRGNLASQRPY